MHFVIGLGVLALIVTTYFFYEAMQAIVLISFVLAIEGGMAYGLFFKMHIPVWEGIFGLLAGNLVVFALPLLGAIGQRFLGRSHQRPPSDEDVSADAKRVKKS